MSSDTLRGHVNAAQAWWKKIKGPNTLGFICIPHHGIHQRRSVSEILRKRSEPCTLDSANRFRFDHHYLRPWWFLWEHGEREHGVLLHRSVTRVPLIIRPPDRCKAVPSLLQKIVLHVERPEGVDARLMWILFRMLPKQAMLSTMWFVSSILLRRL